MEGRRNVESAGNCSQGSFSLVVSHIYIQIKFHCRLFLEWDVGQQSGRTRDLKIDSKQSRYDYEELISWAGAEADRKGEQVLQLRMKLVSSKGLTFTVGMLDVPTVGPGVAMRSWEVGMSKKTDIDITMGLRWERVP